MMEDFIKHSDKQKDFLFKYYKKQIENSCNNTSQNGIDETSQENIDGSFRQINA